MRKLTFGILGLIMTLAAFVNTAKPAHAQVCPLCTIDHHCCLVGNQAKCFPLSKPCP